MASRAIIIKLPKNNPHVPTLVKSLLAELIRSTLSTKTFLVASLTSSFMTVPMASVASKLPSEVGMPPSILKSVTLGSV